MKNEVSTCVDRHVYKACQPGCSFEEARAVVLASYSEKELGEDLLALVRQHLEQCVCCAQFLKSFESTDDSETAGSVPVAVCPSSETLDHYLFDRKALHTAAQREIERHLKECGLCKEETTWLRSVESASPTGSRSWLQGALAIAALFLIALSAFLFFENRDDSLPSAQLKALAVIKEPSQINFVELSQTAQALPAEYQAQYDEAVEHFKAGHFQHASERLEKIVQAYPNHSAATYLLGYSYYKMNEPEKAFQLCDRAEGMKPHAYERCMFLVNLALKTGHFDRAVVEIVNLYHSHSSDPEVNRLYRSIMDLTQGKQVRL